MEQATNFHIRFGTVPSFQTIHIAIFGEDQQALDSNIVNNQLPSFQTVKLVNIVPLARVLSTDQQETIV